jgi:hypothetical protein
MCSSDIAVQSVLLQPVVKDIVQRIAKEGAAVV